MYCGMRRCIDTFEQIEFIWVVISWEIMRVPNIFSVYFGKTDVLEVFAIYRVISVNIFR